MPKRKKKTAKKGTSSSWKRVPRNKKASRKPKSKTKKEADESGRRVVDYESIKPIAAVAQLRDIRMLEFAAQARLVETDGSGDDFERIGYTAKPVPSEDPELLVGLIEFHYDRLREGEQFDVKGQVLVIYRVRTKGDQSTSGTTVRQFIEVNSVFSAWPYIREFVSDSATRLRAAPAMLPVWRPPKMLPPIGEEAFISRHIGQSSEE